MRIPNKKRPAIAVALAIFLIGLMVAGFVMIVFDQIMQFMGVWSTSNFPTNVYQTTTLNFYQDGWAYMGVISVIVLSVWLYIRAQESSVGAD